MEAIAQHPHVWIVFEDVGTYPCLEAVFASEQAAQTYVAQFTERPYRYHIKAQPVLDTAPKVVRYWSAVAAVAPSGKRFSVSAQPGVRWKHLLPPPEESEQDAGNGWRHIRADFYRSKRAALESVRRRLRQEPTERDGG